MLAQRVLECADRALKGKNAFMLNLVGTTERIFDRGFEFIFHEYDTSHKMTSTFPPKPRPKDPLLPPFEDNLLVEHLTDGAASHYLIINKFMVTRGHVVISSDTRGKKQDERLTYSDIAALSQVVSGFSGNGVGYFNAGPESGSTQVHKHTQYAPLDDNPILEKMIDNAKIPFKYYITPLRSIAPDVIFEGYEKLMRDANWSGSYNFFVYRKHSILVPRTAARHAWGKVVNALGVAGHFTIFSHMDKRIKQHPMTVVEELCLRQ